MDGISPVTAPIADGAEDRAADEEQWGFGEVRERDALKCCFEMFCQFEIAMSQIYNYSPPVRSKLLMRIFKRGEGSMGMMRYGRSSEESSEESSEPMRNGQSEESIGF